MLKSVRLTIGRKIYAILAMSFIGFLGVILYQVQELNASLEEQKRIELHHLTEGAIGAVKEEYAAAQKGLISTEQAQERAKARLRVMRYGKGDYFWINDMQPRMVMHPVMPELEGKDATHLKDPSGQPIMVAFVDLVRREKQGYLYYVWPRPGAKEPLPKVSYLVGFEPGGWVIGTGVYLDELRGDIWQKARNVLIVAALVLLITGIVSGVVARGLSKAMGGMSNAMRELAAGNLHVVLPGIGRRDEIGDIAAAVEEFKLRAVEKAQQEADERDAQARAAAAERRQVEEREAAQKRAADEKAAAERRVALNALAEQFESAVGHSIDTVSAASRELEGAAGTLSQAAATTQRMSDSAAAASEEASSNVQSVASAAEQLTSSVGEISRQVNESSRIAGEAVRQAQKTDSRISELSQAAGRIGDVVKLITAIAEQTNLLALNATIEAARAGESGKGFAVVAQEVKALASQTAKATDEIGNQISSMQAATQDSVAAIKEIGTTITRIAEIAGSVAAAVEQQGEATTEIAGNVQRAARGTTAVATNVADVSRGAADTGTASGQVLTSAKSLAHESALLKREVAKFLDTVRAA